mmetsp:Transcript_32021/g.124625  ORF Transcript_32021/g.124625 Transcript_32021/m.124625 type:complete len:219 (-) Transcript_32021:1633-2289(-)
MYVSMKVDVVAGHVPLHNQLILLRVASRNNEVVLTRDEPVKFLKPKRLPLLSDCLGGSDLLQLPSGLLLRAFQCLRACILRFHLLLGRCLLHSKILLCVLPWRHVEVDGDELRFRIILSLKPFIIKLIIIASWSQLNGNLIAVQMKRVDNPKNWVIVLLLLFQHPIELFPIHARNHRASENCQCSLNLFDVVLNEHSAFLARELLVFQLRDPPIELTL